MTGGYLFHRRLADLAPTHDARITFVSIPQRRFPLPILSAPAALRRARRLQPHVVVVDSIVAAYVAPFLGAVALPAVAMLHQPAGGIDQRWPGAQPLRWLDRVAYRQMRLLLVASQSLADALAPSPIPLRVIPPGRDPSPNPQPAGDLRCGRRAAILCVANWLPNKGIAELLDALATLPPDAATLHLAGDTTVDPRYSARLEQRLAQPDLAGRVVVHGRLPPPRVAGLYQAADLFCMPSFHETYGTVWGEAMAAGLPIVGWRAGNLPHLADHGREALLVEPGDVDALGHALGRLIDDQPLRRALGATARRRAGTRPTWDQTAAAFFDALRDVASDEFRRRTETARA
jgi:glycosyltransferase involved in cell wall biosynthesis